VQRIIKDSFDQHVILSSLVAFHLLVTLESSVQPVSSSPYAYGGHSNSTTTYAALL
jgi:hypothetical protein